MRKAFSMLMAIFIIVLMATVAAFIMNLSGKMVQETTAQFQREQSVLLAKSYTEYAIMAVTANEHNTANCLNHITGAYGDSDGDGVGDIYNINVDISYIGNTNLDASCNTLSNGVVNEKSPLSIIVDVFVRYKDLDHPAGAGAPDITYHRRSLQKI
jgi:hypothetical protein